MTLFALGDALVRPDGVEALLILAAVGEPQLTLVDI